MAAKSTTACDSPLCEVLASVENVFVVVVGRPDEVLFLEERRDDNWPLVLRMAPVARSRTTVALTPDFFDSRPL
jgi:hypothetical protein